MTQCPTLAQTLPQTQQSADPTAAAAGLQAPMLESATLFRGHQAIVISHNGVLYRLQATRLGKLILTK